MLFRCVRGYPGMRLVTGVLASRDRAALLLGTAPERLAFRMMEAVAAPVPTVMAQAAPCQEVVHREPVDLMRLLPIPTNTAQDAGPISVWGCCGRKIPRRGKAM